MKNNYECICMFRMSPKQSAKLDESYSEYGFKTRSALIRAAISEYFETHSDNPGTKWIQ